MTKISFSQFQSLVGLSDAACCWLLRENKLPCSYEPTDGLMVDITHVDSINLITAISARKEEFSSRAAEIVREKIGSLVEESLTRIYERALAQFLAQRGGQTS